MRKIELIAVILLFITHSISAKNEHKISAKVDERIELLSVVCRLAEFKEYVNNNIPSYAKDVDTYFAEYKSHELITLAKKLNKERSGGLPEGKIENLFLPFTQNGRDKSGLGLGLSICQRAVQANHGTLSARDLPGLGSVFSISLPKHTNSK